MELSTSHWAFSTLSPSFHRSMSECTAVPAQSMRMLAMCTRLRNADPGQSPTRIMFPYLRISGPIYAWRNSKSSPGFSAFSASVTSLSSLSTPSGIERQSRPA